MQPNDSAFPLGEDQARGLTKREYFAAQALVGYLTLFSGHDDDLPREGLAACWAVHYADALIAELSKPVSETQPRKETS
jgi:DNA-binding transcriptional regulator PaaX